MNQSFMKHNSETSKEDLKKVEDIGGKYASGLFKFPRNSYRGELRTHGVNGGQYIARVYVVDHKVFIANPREFGNGEIVEMISGEFSPSEFERCGGYNVSATRRVNFWRFKKTEGGAQ
jgi:hypothetical protein